MLSRLYYLIQVMSTANSPFERTENEGVRK
nr:MAG TPA: Flagellar protein FlbT [Caudoviricetes sp.]